MRRPRHCSSYCDAFEHSTCTSRQTRSTLSITSAAASRLGAAVRRRDHHVRQVVVADAQLDAGDLLALVNWTRLAPASRRVMVTPGALASPFFQDGDVDLVGGRFEYYRGGVVARSSLLLRLLRHLLHTPHDVARAPTTHCASAIPETKSASMAPARVVLRDTADAWQVLLRQVHQRGTVIARPGRTATRPARFNANCNAAGSVGRRH